MGAGRNRLKWGGVVVNTVIILERGFIHFSVRTETVRLYFFLDFITLLKIICKLEFSVYSLFM